MRIAVAGGHGQVAMLLHPLLAEHGHEVRGLIRNPDHAEDVRRAGAEPVICDLEAESDPAGAVSGADAIVFTAGAGPGSGPERKRTLDRDGALRLIDAARDGGIRRYVMLSAMKPEQPRGNEVFQVYLRAKAEADAVLRDSGLDWTIVRPGRLTDEPGTGRVAAASELERADIARADVAAVLAAVLEMPETIGLQFEVVAGDTPIREALSALAAAR